MHCAGGEGKISYSGEEEINSINFLMPSCSSCVLAAANPLQVCYLSHGWYTLDIECKGVLSIGV